MFESLDPVLLARIQFAFTVSFHIIFPAFSIGLASYLAVLEGLWLKTGRTVYLDLFKYWIKIFAVGFGMGVVSGVVMSYQFGTNWAVFADKAGPVIGPLMGYEVMTAFFLEAGFLGVMLFGMNRVGKGLHFFATLMVAAGTLFSAFWILSVNSWMQTPAGYAINEAGQFVPEDWWEIIFNPSFPYRFAHMTLAPYLTVALVVGATGAYHLLRDCYNEHARTMFIMAMGMIAVVAPIQAFVGDQHGLNTLEYQPAKIAAMEGHFETMTGAPLLLFGIPDMEAQRTDYKIEIPHLSSLILTHTWDGELKGLKEWPREDQPNALILFFSFRIMVGLALLMIAMGFTAVFLCWRGQLFDATWFHRIALCMGPAGFIAVLAGWITTEVGRQPYTVYGLLRTEDSASPLDAPAVGLSLIGFIVVYFALFGAGIYYMLRMMAKPPHPDEPARASDHPVRSAGITPGPAMSQRQSPVAGG